MSQFASAPHTSAVSLSREEARRLLTLYHFRQSDLAGVFAHLGSVQYDPLNPVGRNPDLVLQARVPGYRVDDWQPLAYQQRLVYDAWDKQACLVPAADWPQRALIRAYHCPDHDRQLLDSAQEATAAILAAIDERGPLSSLEFEEQAKAVVSQLTWHGTKLAKLILRSLWACGRLVTHHRQAGRHYYDRPERVIPAEHFNAPLLLDPEAYQRWIIAQRHRAAGLLRPTAEACIWSGCGSTRERRTTMAQLVEEGTLIPLLIGEKRWPYYAHRNLLPLLEAPTPEPRVIFLGPLDNFLWDRKGIQQIYDFEYIWEVYKPEKDRKWGYYVLPVLYRDRFIARLDSRLEGKTWHIARWWWEPGIAPDDEMLEALRLAVRNFLAYLSADSIQLAEMAAPALQQLALP